MALVKEVPDGADMVEITEMINAGSFWVTMSYPDTESWSKPRAQLEMIEMFLAAAKLTAIPKISAPRVQELVTVKHPQTGKWHRGRVHSIKEAGRSFYSVFLIDHGRTVEVPASAIRDIDTYYTKQEALAYRILLLGIVPGTPAYRDRLYEQAEWSKAANILVEKWIAKSPLGYFLKKEKLVNENILCGELYLVAEDGFINLGKLLCNQKYAIANFSIFKERYGGNFKKESSGLSHMLPFTGASSEATQPANPLIRRHLSSSVEHPKSSQSERQKKKKFHELSPSTFEKGSQKESLGTNWERTSREFEEKSDIDRIRKENISIATDPQISCIKAEYMDEADVQCRGSIQGSRMGDLRGGAKDTRRPELGMSKSPGGPSKRLPFQKYYDFPDEPSSSTNNSYIAPNRSQIIDKDEKSTDELHKSFHSERVDRSTSLGYKGRNDEMKSSDKNMGNRISPRCNKESYSDARTTKNNISLEETERRDKFQESSSDSRFRGKGTGKPSERNSGTKFNPRKNENPDIRIFDIPEISPERPIRERKISTNPNRSEALGEDFEDKSPFLYRGGGRTSSSVKKNFGNRIRPRKTEPSDPDKFDAHKQALEQHYGEGKCSINPSVPRKFDRFDEDSEDRSQFLFRSGGRTPLSHNRNSGNRIPPQKTRFTGTGNFDVQRNPRSGRCSKEETFPTSFNESRNSERFDEDSEESSQFMHKNEERTPLPPNKKSVNSSHPGKTEFVDTDIQKRLHGKWSREDKFSTNLHVPRNSERFEEDSEDSSQFMFKNEETASLSSNKSIGKRNHPRKTEYTDNGMLDLQERPQGHLSREEKFSTHNVSRYSESFDKEYEGNTHCADKSGVRVDISSRNVEDFYSRERETSKFDTHELSKRLHKQASRKENVSDFRNVLRTSETSLEKFADDVQTHSVECRYGEKTSASPEKKFGKDIRNVGRNGDEIHRECASQEDELAIPDTSFKRKLTPKYEVQDFGNGKSIVLKRKLKTPVRTFYPAGFNMAEADILFVEKISPGLDNPSKRLTDLASCVDDQIKCLESTLKICQEQSSREENDSDCGNVLRTSETSPKNADKVQIKGRGREKKSPSPEKKFDTGIHPKNLNKDVFDAGNTWQRHRRNETTPDVANKYNNKEIRFTANVSYGSSEELSTEVNVNRKLETSNPLSNSKDSVTSSDSQVNSSESSSDMHKEISDVVRASKKQGTLRERIYKNLLLTEDSYSKSVSSTPESSKEEQLIHSKRETKQDCLFTEYANNSEILSTLRSNNEEFLQGGLKINDSSWCKNSQMSHTLCLNDKERKSFQQMPLESKQDDREMECTSSLGTSKTQGCNLFTLIENEQRNSPEKMETRVVHDETALTENKCKEAAFSQSSTVLEPEQLPSPEQRFWSALKDGMSKSHFTDANFSVLLNQFLTNYSKRSDSELLETNEINDPMSADLSNIATAAAVTTKVTETNTHSQGNSSTENSFIKISETSPALTTEFKAVSSRIDPDVSHINELKVLSNEILKTSASGIKKVVGSLASEAVSADMSYGTLSKDVSEIVPADDRENVPALRNSETIPLSVCESIQSEKLMTRSDVSNHRSTDKSLARPNKVSETNAAEVSDGRPTKESEAKADEVSEVKPTKESEAKAVVVSDARPTNVSDAEVAKVSEVRPTNMSKAEAAEVSDARTMKVSEAEATETLGIRSTRISEDKPVDIWEASSMIISDAKRAEVSEIRPAEIVETSPLESVEAKPVKDAEARPAGPTEVAGIKPSEIVEVRQTDVTEVRPNADTEVRPMEETDIKPAEVLETELAEVLETRETQEVIPTIASKSIQSEVTDSCTNIVGTVLSEDSDNSALKSPQTSKYSKIKNVKERGSSDHSLCEKQVVLSDISNATSIQMSEVISTEVSEVKQTENKLTEGGGVLLEEESRAKLLNVTEVSPECSSECSKNNLKENRLERDSSCNTENNKIDGQDEKKMKISNKILLHRIINVDPDPCASLVLNPGRKLMDQLQLMIVLLHGAPENFRHLNVITDAVLRQDVHEVLKTIMNRLMRIQKYAWPLIQQGHSCAIVNPPMSGKTLGYAVPLLDQMLQKVQTDQIPKGNGPVMLVLCSGSKSCNSIRDIFYLFTRMSSTEVKMLVAYGGGAEKIEFKLVNGCHILISTPRCFKRLLALGKVVVNFHRLKYLVLDEADILTLRFLPEVELICKSIERDIKQEKGSLQVVAAAEKWCPGLEGLVRSLPRPVVCLGAFMEALVYAHLKPHLHYVTQNTKIPIVQEILETTNKKHRTLVVCREAMEVEAIYGALESLSHLMMAHDNMDTSDIHEIYVKWSWMEYPVLVCTDAILQEMSFQGATLLIHFSLATVTRREFAFRCSTLIDQMPSMFESQTEKEAMLQPEMHIFLSEDDSAPLPTLVRYLKRLGVTFDPDLQKRANAAEVAKEVQKDYVPLCCNTKAFGDCWNRSKCIFRHVIDGRDKPRNIPTNGTIKVKILFVHDACNFSGRILEHINENGNISVMRNLIISVSRKMQTYFKDETNRILLERPKAYDVGAVEEPRGVFRRIEILAITKVDRNENPTELLVRFIDEGCRELVKAEKVFVLSQNLQEIPPQSVELHLCRLIPCDLDWSWGAVTNEKVAKILSEAENKGRYLLGKIKLGLGHTLWLDPLECYETLPTLKTDAIIFSLRRRLLEEQLAVENPQHLQLLYQACARGGLEVPNTTVSDSSSHERTEEKVDMCWAHLPADEFSLVYFIVGDHPGRFYVRLQKFEDLVHKLDKKLYKIAREKKSTDRTLFTGDYCIGRFPTDDRWYRARVENAQDDNLDLFFVDHGDRATVSRSEAVPLPKDLISQLPFQAIECRFAGVGPDQGDRWSEKSIDALYDFTAKAGTIDGVKLLYAKVLDKMKPADCTGGYKYHIALIEVTPHGRALLNNTLVAWGLASQTEEQKQQLLAVDLSQLTPPVDLPSEDESDEEYELEEGEIEGQSVNATEITFEEDWNGQQEPSSFNTSGLSCSLDSTSSTEARLESSFANFDFSAVTEDEIMEFFEKTMEDYNTKVTEPTTTTISEEQEEKGVSADAASEPSTALETSREARSEGVQDMEPQVNKSLKECGNSCSSSDEEMENFDTASDGGSSLPALIRTTRTPLVYWHQNAYFVWLRVDLPGVEKYYLKWDNDYIQFWAMIEDLVYAFDVNLFGPINPEALTHNGGLFVRIKMEKVFVGMDWLRLRVEPEKVTWLKRDYDAENDSDIEELHLAEQLRAIKEMERKKENRIEKGGLLPADEAPYEDADESDSNCSDVVLPGDEDYDPYDPMN